MAVIGPFPNDPLRGRFATLDIAAFYSMKEEATRMRMRRIETDDVYGVSFNPGRAIQGRDAGDDAEQRLGKLVSDWSRRLDTSSLGFDRRHLHKLKTCRPVYALVAQEGARTWHYHGVAFVPRNHVEAFEHAAQRTWEAISPGGDMDMDPLPDSGWLAYINRKVRRDQPFTFQIIPDPVNRQQTKAA